MLLAVDVGNSQTVAGLFSGDELLHDWRVSTIRRTTVDELAASHDNILQLRGGSLTEVDHMVVASVVPELTVSYQALADRYLDRPAVVVGPGVRIGRDCMLLGRVGLNRGVSVGEGACLGASTITEPGVQVPAGARVPFATRSLWDTPAPD